MTVGNALFGMLKVILGLCGVINLLAGTLAAVAGQVAVAGVALPAGLILCIAANVDRFETIKGLGVEATVRKIDAKLAAAQATLAQVRAVAELTGELNIDLLSKIGRWDAAPSAKDGYEVMVRTRDMLLAVQSDPGTIDKVLAPWARVFCFDLARAITADIQSEHRKALRQLDAEHAAITKPIDLHDPLYLENSRLRHELGATMSKLTALWTTDDPAQLWRELSLLLPELKFMPGQAREQLRARVDIFLPQVLSFLATKQLDAPAAWISAIDQHRAREQA